MRVSLLVVVALGMVLCAIARPAPARLGKGSVYMQEDFPGATQIQVYMGQPYPEMMAVYQNGELLHVLKVSTGRSGFATPTGTFTIIAKNDTAVSSEYHSAMEFAMRLGPKYTGINIHQEVVPDYPASHGCVRTHFKSAIIMFELTALGSTVTISNDAPPSWMNYTEDYSTGTYERNYFAEGDQDGGVVVVQRQLSLLGLLEDSQLTGVYDEDTIEAVKKYQASKDLPTDGIAGDSTMQTMLAYLNHGF